jgi:DNA-binding CsgD family transcriptional regulator
MDGLPDIADLPLRDQPEEAVARFSIDRVDCLVVPSENGQLCAAGCAGTFVVAGRRYSVFCAQPGLAAPDPVELLTPRELEVALLVAAGYGTKAVARRLRISFHTVRVHVCRIYAKLGLHKQTELAVRIGARFGAGETAERASPCDGAEDLVSRRTRVA